MEDTRSKMKNSRFNIYTPIVLALVLAAGIFIGSRLRFSDKPSNFIFRSEPNKIDMLLDLIEENYVDTVTKSDLIEKSIPLILEQLDPHSVYIPAEDLQAVSEPLEGNFEGIGIQFQIIRDSVNVISTISTTSD